MGQQERLKITIVDKDIGHWIANVRTEHGFTQTQLAYLVGSRQSSISRIENNKVSPSITTVNKLFKAMGVRLYMGASDA